MTPDHFILESSCVMHFVLTYWSRSVSVLSTLKEKMLTLAILFQRLLASHSLVRAFVQGVAHISPPIRSRVSMEP